MLGAFIAVSQTRRDVDDVGDNYHIVYCGAFVVELVMSPAGDELHLVVVLLAVEAQLPNG